jgi:hypothetical protein
VLDDYKKKLIDPISSSVSSPGSFPYLKNYTDMNSSKQQSPPPNEIKKEVGEASPAFGGGQAKAPKFSENLNQLLDSEVPKKENKAQEKKPATTTYLDEIFEAKHPAQAKAEPQVHTPIPKKSIHHQPQVPRKRSNHDSLSHLRYSDKKYEIPS